MADSSYDYLFKVLLIGDEGVGKSAVLYHYLGETTDSAPTVAIEFRMKQTVLNSSKIKLQIWDTSGEDNWSSYKAVYSGTKGILLFYSITNWKSFANITKWFDIIRTYLEPVPPVVIVATNSENVHERVVSTSMGQSIVSKYEWYEFGFIEVSAKTGDNVGLAFEQLSLAMLSNAKFSDQNPSTKPVQCDLKAPTKPTQSDQKVPEKPASSTKKSHDYLFKILLIGDSSAGKTELLLRYTDAYTDPTFIPSIGIDFKTKDIELNGSKIKLQIWDTAGQERFRTITTAYYRGAMGILLVYDVTNMNTFQNVTEWFDSIDKYASSNIQIMLVGTNSEKLDKRVVSTSMGQTVATDLNVAFYEVSAKTGENVNLVFDQLSQAILNVKKTTELPSPKEPLTKSYDHIFKIVMLGDDFIGKTHLLFRYTKKHLPNRICATIGVDFAIKFIQLNGSKIKLQIWDTAGQERFHNIILPYCAMAMGILVVYDVTNMKTFQNVADWFERIQMHASKTVQILLVGNKCDELDRRIVSTSMGQALAAKYGVRYMDVSSKSGENVSQAFEQLSLAILTRLFS